MSNSQVFHVAGVRITVDAEGVSSSGMRENVAFERAVTAVAREFADNTEVQE